MNPIPDITCTFGKYYQQCLYNGRKIPTCVKDKLQFCTTAKLGIKLWVCAGKT